MIVNNSIIRQLRVNHQSKSPMLRLMALLLPRLQCQLGTDIFLQEGEEASFCDVGFITGVYVYKKERAVSSWIISMWCMLCLLFVLFTVIG
jgi:hypothetical protein